MYYYKKNSYEYYEQLHSKWLSACPVDPFESVNYDGSPEHEALLDAWRHAHKLWERKEPQIEWILVEPSGSYCVDLNTGYAPSVLLLHQRFTKKFPTVPVRQVLERCKRKHIHWENVRLDPHTVRISLYESDSLRNLQTLEVDLWQEIPDVERLVADALEVLRTPALKPRLYRY